MSKGKTIGELLEEARKKSGAPKLAGHDIMDLERFAPDTRHMIVFDVLSHESPVGFKGERIRLFLTDEGYKKALTSNGLLPGKELMEYVGIPHRKDTRLYRNGKSPFAKYGAIAQSKGASISHVVPAERLGLHHKRACPYMQRWR